MTDPMNPEIRDSYLLIWEALAKAYRADDPELIAHAIMEKYGNHVVSVQTSSEIIADIYLRSTR